MSLVRKWVLIFTATLTGGLVLLGYLLPGQRTLVLLRSTLLEWAVVVVAFAFLLGLGNILRVHGARLVRVSPGWVYSLILIIAVAVGLIVAFVGAEASLTQSVYTIAARPLGASMAALLLFTLVAAVFRLFRARRSFDAVVFLIAVLLTLVLSTPFIGLGPTLQGPREFLVHVLGMAGVRGLLIGVALGTLISALRVLLVGDWPHSEAS
ncbi:MAG: hypothetical protein GX620_01635 [Chloroflexi bacterium]|nr:hypothetical protein [Chloroflexota bacterium]